MRMLWWLLNPTWTIREEFTWVFWWIYNSAWTIWKEFTWEIYGDSIFKNEIFRRNSGENAVLTLLSNMSYQGGVHDSVIHSGRGYDKMLWWIDSATWAIWKEFTWECYGDFILKNKSFWRSSREHLWRFNSSRWPIDSGEIHVRMRWRFHSATWVIQIEGTG